MQYISFENVENAKVVCIEVRVSTAGIDSILTPKGCPFEF